ncbi:MAG: hypothetical protein ACO3QC_07820 [Phycisphaerales bacterium]
MKSMMRLVTVLAFANLLAIAGFVAWLGATGRLNRDRIDRVREVFAHTVTEEERLAGEEAAKAEESVRLASEERRLLEVPMSRSEQIVSSARFEQRAALAIRALEEERRRMQADLADREQSVTAREGALGERQSAWEKSIADEKARAIDEQFRKAVRLLEAMPAKQGKEWILELVKSGREDMAVTYLDAMNPAKSANLLKAFKGEDEAKVATDLLERLRQLGLESELGAGRSDDAKTADIPAEPARSDPEGGAKPAGPTSNGPLKV